MDTKVDIPNVSQRQPNSQRRCSAGSDVTTTYKGHDAQVMSEPGVLKCASAHSKHILT